MTKVLFDITRIFIRGARFSPTGIDRVVVAYAKWLLDRPDTELRPVLTLGGRLFGAPHQMFERIIRENQAFARQRSADDEPSPNWQALRHLLGAEPDPAQPLRAHPISRQLPHRVRWYSAVAVRALANLRPLTPQAGWTYVNVSHTGLDQRRVLSRLREAGIAPVVMVHDLIPINFPEYCAPSSEERHCRRIEEITREACLVVTNSRTTACELREYAAAKGSRTPAIVVAPLGIDEAFQRAPPLWSPARPYFLCVGTLEARKNLAFLLALWRQLADSLGAQAPRLVLVGRRGWENESVIDHLERSKAVIRLVHEASDLRDRELAQLMAGATALISPSLAEGFDLPVIEALAVGTPVIASDIPAHRELAGTLATLIDPMDGPKWLATIRAAMQSPKQRIPFAAPTWHAHFARLDQALGSLSV